MQIKYSNVLIDKIFSIRSKTEFDTLALEVFQLQYTSNSVYKSYVNTLGIDIQNIKAIQDIPFLPVSFFKTYEIICGDKKEYEKMFYSSTTSSSIPSKHFVKECSIYTESFRRCFNQFYGNIKDYCVLALLPSYLEREGSSLVYMAEDLIKTSGHTKSGFYMHNYDELIETLTQLEKQGQKVLLLGVTYALLKLAEESPMSLRSTVIMETGGMKGKREELPKQEVHALLQKAFGMKHIHSEYGMTELLSQAYSKGGGVFNAPPWMQIGIRDIYDPLKVQFKSGSGAINIIDLANINSCAFIATDDVGHLNKNGSFEITGRIDYSDMRGCNLMAEDL
jgi:phenylacetate-coenzyme A ligase PaaK-like adenylate-forming protein